MDREELKERVLGALRRQPPPAPAGTPREVLLALSELARRHGGDVPGGEPGELAGFELRVFSQNGEDGVLAEILRRTGAPARWFVEFGAGDGTENNCRVLADVLGWQGLFMDAGDRQFELLAHRYGGHPAVRVAQTMVTPETIDALLERHGVPAEPDVVSVDVDGSDYWIWEAMAARPRVVVIEYNGSLPVGRRLVQPRDAGPWDETDFYGASIEALVELGERKGYRLVHCEMTGNNAFFVRNDVPGAFLEPGAVVRRRTNFWLEGVRHAPDPQNRAYVELDAGPVRQAHSEP
jgi:hypothetical protein